MGEVNLSLSRKDDGKRRLKKLSTRVDLTPMVDLGFLLITFFIFTTSMSEPKAMKLTVPNDKSTIDPSKAAEEKTLNIIIDGSNTLWHYPGVELSSMTKTFAMSKGIRHAIIRKKIDVGRIFGDSKETVILIKPTQEASYRDIVQVLDEMTINGVSRYFFLEANKDELSAIRALE